LCLSVWLVLCCVCVPVFMGLQVLGVCCAKCHCVRLSVGVCALLRCVCGALSVPVMAGFALCGAVGVCRCCAGCAYGGCALWCCVCDFINKNKGLECFLNVNYGKKLDKNTVCCEKTTG
jgi:hypothetical protein